MNRSRPLRKVSRKRKKELDEYSKTRKQYLDLHDTCEVCKARKATEIHHKAGRFASRLNDVNNFLAVCRDCHIMVTLNARWSIENGYSKWI